MAGIRPYLTEEKARDVVRALAVHARSLAEPSVRGQNSDEIRRLDALRRDLEGEIDKRAR